MHVGTLQISLELIVGFRLDRVMRKNWLLLITLEGCNEFKDGVSMEIDMFRKVRAYHARNFFDGFKLIIKGAY